jgi:7,8-dihydropterin-6-yl-methyl-4-(beta-D-ribofuranosyl)aminobenzene 5'-phosphate synthase
MNIKADDPDMIVLSHGHHDHGNGLHYLKGGTIICHPGCVVPRYRRTDRSFIGLRDVPGITTKFSIHMTVSPFRITDRIIFLGEIPRINSFESLETPFILEDGSPDFVQDDSALALIHDEGLCVITGCGHAGIVNTLNHAILATGIEKIFLVMGGFHLKYNDKQLNETISFLRDKDIKHIIPSHCTGLPAMASFYNAFQVPQLKTGDILEF